jgi:dipeptidyl aminopeptidase/acylaminoacyl peptidase
MRSTSAFLGLGLVCGALTVLGALGVGAAEPPLIPMRDFFRNPEQVGYELSPNGEYVAYLAPWQSRLNVHVQKVGLQAAADQAPVRVTSATARDIMGFTWKGSDRLVYVQDTGGDENYRLYAVGIDGSNPKDLTPFPGIQTRFVDPLEDNDSEMLISLNRRDPRVFDVYRVNVDTGDLALIAENPGNITGWMTDNLGRLRVASTADGVNTSVLYRATEADTFRTLLTTSFKDQFNPLYFSFDDRLLYVSSNLDRDKAAIYRYDPERGELLDLVYEHPEVDVQNLLRSRARKVFTGVAFTTDQTGYHFFDDQRRKLQERLEQQLPGYEVALVSTSRDEQKALVVTYSDRSMGSYYFYDVAADKLRKLADVSPWLKEEWMAEMKPISYRSRDGLTIHGYLTLPSGKEPRNLPVVVNPHGGPWYRDRWGFDPESQFLANRGYAVLKVNFRGSTGYGKAFWEASTKQWGKAMQDDISDGVRWLIDQGIADPKRVAIYGGSYGGYATLAGLAFTPELYACGVDYVGVSNLFTFLNSLPPYWEPMRRMWYELIGNPETEKDLLTAASPIFHVDRIRAPLLVAQGANDPRVKQAESEQIVAALRQRGIDVEYILKENEGHGFLLEENRFEFYRAMERFLGKHLGGRVEATTG